MTIKIKTILGVGKKAHTTITTALFNDGGEELIATGVGEYAEGEVVHLFHDDKYNRLKFTKIKYEKTENVAAVN